MDTLHENLQKIVYAYLEVNWHGQKLYDRMEHTDCIKYIFSTSPMTFG